MKKDQLGDPHDRGEAHGGHSLRQVVVGRSSGSDCATYEASQRYRGEWDALSGMPGASFSKSALAVVSLAGIEAIFQTVGKAETMLLKGATL